MAYGNDSDVVRRELDPEIDDAAVQIVECIADIEEVDVVDLPSMYDCIDGVLDDVFSRPPSPNADLEITFTYAGFRITVEQDGTATFVPRS